MATSRNSSLTLILIVLGVIFVAAAIFYAVATTSFLAGSTGHHYKHAIAFAVAAVLAFIGANFTRNAA